MSETKGRYRNDGAPWTRADGTRVERGAVFEPTPEELLRRAYKLRPSTEPLTLVVDDQTAFPEGLDAVEFTKLDHRRAAAVVDTLPDGDPRLDEFLAAEQARGRGARESVVAAFAARGLGLEPAEEGQAPS